MFFPCFVPCIHFLQLFKHYCNDIHLGKQISFIQLQPYLNSKVLKKKDSSAVSMHGYYMCPYAFAFWYLYNIEVLGRKNISIYLCCSTFDNLVPNCTIWRCFMEHFFLNSSFSTIVHKLTLLGFQHWNPESASKLKVV